jgi:type IV secretion system protein VirB10
MINVLVRGAAPYTVMDRWELNRDGSRLTIERVIQRGSNEAESKLVYSREGEGAVALATRTGEQAPHATSFLIAKGTRIPLRMLGTVSSRTAQEGDRVYLETSFPVTDKGRVVIPPGSQVAASVTHVQQPGRVKGRSELMLRFESLVLPNGVTRDFRARAATVEPGAGELDSEGKVKGPASKGEDARKIGETTAAGAGVGGLAGAAGGGAGSGTAIGAAAGAAAGLGRVLVGRGEQTTLRKGDAVEMVLDRNLVFTGEELAGGR